VKRPFGDVTENGCDPTRAAGVLGCPRFRMSVDHSRAISLLLTPSSQPLPARIRHGRHKEEPGECVSRARCVRARTRARVCVCDRHTGGSPASGDLSHARSVRSSEMEKRCLPLVAKATFCTGA